jgi:hypothetical protein
MSDPSGKYEPPTREITARVHGISGIEIFEITEDELDNVESAFGQSAQSLSFFTGSISIVATCIVGLLTTARALSPHAFGGLVGATVALGMLSLWFGIGWWRAKKRGPELIQRVKERRRIQ